MSFFAAANPSGMWLSLQGCCMLLLLFLGRCFFFCCVYRMLNAVGQRGEAFAASSWKHAFKVTVDKNNPVTEWCVLNPRTGRHVRSILDKERLQGSCSRTSSARSDVAFDPRGKRCVCGFCLPYMSTCPVFWTRISRRLAQSCARKKNGSTGKSDDLAERKRTRSFKALDTI